MLKGISSSKFLLWSGNSGYFLHIPLPFPTWLLQHYGVSTVSQLKEPSCFLVPWSLILILLLIFSWLKYSYLRWYLTSTLNPFPDFPYNPFVNYESFVFFATSPLLFINLFSSRYLFQNIDILLDPMIKFNQPPFCLFFPNDS